MTRDLVDYLWDEIGHDIEKDLQTDGVDYDQYYNLLTAKIKKVIDKYKSCEHKSKTTKIVSYPGPMIKRVVNEHTTCDYCGKVWIKPLSQS